MIGLCKMESEAQESLWSDVERAPGPSVSHPGVSKVQSLHFQTALLSPAPITAAHSASHLFLHNICSKERYC